MFRRSILCVAEKFKPLLLKIVPRTLLQRIKQDLLAELFGEIETYQLLPYEKDLFSVGINLIGNIKADTGLGQSCRLMADLIKKAEIPLSVFLYDSLAGANNQTTAWDALISDKLPYGINLVHLNPNELGMAYVNLKKETWEKHYNIAFWLWELEEFPDEWVPCINLFHEIWTPSEFVSNSIRKKTNKLVNTISYNLSVEVNEKCDRNFFGLPDNKFLYLMMYDTASVAERKNPIGAIKAFKKAFSVNDTSVGLVIKMKGYSPKEEALIKEELKGYSNIYFITGIFTRDEVGALISNCDVLVSLHRAEGFGLPLAEAMYLGIPTVATDWSANTEFMNSAVACMVDYKLVEIKKDYGPYKAGNYWAEPDTDYAADLMRKLFEDKAFYLQKAKCGTQYVKEVLGVSAATKKITKRMEQINNAVV